jgi:PhzF family phenazine biosynthesis protein
MRHFRQVDVFSAAPLLGNPVAVVHDADDLSDEQMAAFARWTNLSETTFLLAPTTADADYRVRIFTPGGELPFAGHPTLGTAHAWIEAGGSPKQDRIVQECGVGLVEVRRDGGRLAFAAPALLRFGPVSDQEVRRIAAGLRIGPEEIVAAQWVDNGPGWVAVQLVDAAAVLSIWPDAAGLGDLAVGTVGLHPEGSECAIEVRAFVGGLGVAEDPVTGSLNAGVAQWLIGDGTLPASYVASQGTVLGRRGRVHIDAEGETVWVGGATTTTITGTVSL